MRRTFKVTIEEIPFDALQPGDVFALVDPGPEAKEDGKILWICGGKMRETELPSGEKTATVDASNYHVHIPVAVDELSMLAFYYRTGRTPQFIPQGVDDISVPEKAPAESPAKK